MNIQLTYWDLEPCYITAPIYNVALTITKLSALCQLLRFFVMPRPRAAAKTLLWVVVMYGIAIPIVCIFSCRPINSWWDRSIQGQKCINLTAFWYINASLNIVTDIAVVALPLYVLKDLNLPRRQKWAVNAIFLVGGM